MKNPVSTYRVQLSPEYTLEDLEEILDYLDAFGISTIYAAPLFQARKGSSHGYDITNPFQLNKEIGKLDLFKRISDRLQQKNMTWLQDIVPNHMAFDGDNIWLQDIFELGPEASQYNFFDIDWEQSGKLMAPFLGSPLEEVISKKELKLKVSKNGFSVTYFDHEYPAAARSYALILEGFKSWEEKFRDFSGEKERWEELKEFLVREYQKDPDFRNSINKRLIDINASEEKLKEILEQQYFQPAHWKETETKINYRRFFTINDLICLRMEEEQVFESYHRFILQLCEEELIQGLRIDHIDGLFDPKAYLEKLREKLGPDFYIIIEKILEWDEKLPVHWPVQGTSGYGFLATVNQVLTNKESAELFLKAYKDVDPGHSNYNDLVYNQKLFILKERMGGEYENLWRLAVDLQLLEDRQESKLKEALGAFLAGFSVYRIYPEEYPLRKRQEKIIEAAYKNAVSHSVHLEKELYQLKLIFLGEAEKNRDNMLQFLQRCQQFTGPLAAKGVEDTSFYIYNELISHNEVGDSPEVFGLSAEGFHQRMQLRKEDFPLSVNATATHDTKRGEDSRMRINVLTELGQEWFDHVAHWKQISEKLRQEKKTPDANEEYFIYQMLIGAWPFDGVPGEEFLERSTTYLQKVLREAKVNSSWAQPNEQYETQVYNFLEQLIKNEDFLQSFGKFHSKVAAYGAIKSLSQSLLKITAPGIPDVYQGTELWDLSYVDPDNRRPVDYPLRKQFLKEISSEPDPDLLKSLKQDYKSGKIKMFSIHRALKARKQFPEVFEKGDYLPLEVTGRNSKSLIAFARKFQEKVVITVVPTLVTSFFDEQLQLRNDTINDLKVLIPEELSGSFKNEFTGRSFSSEELDLNTIFADFPVALLIKQA